MKLLSQAPGMREFTVNNGKVIKRDKDSTFNVNDSLGKSLVKSGEMVAVGTNLRSAQGYRCETCGHLGVFKDRCKCGGTDLRPEG
jgi:hypothetical protein